ncbi:MAG: helix-turn-helix domain-containing protein [bacterium]|nr:helix-turn-helix domain-containing protein [bacterium]
MTIPKTVWRYSQETEAARIIQSACQIANRFYLKSGFLVLPRLIERNPRIVYFPNLPYSQIPGLWEEVKISHLEIKIDEPKSLILEVAGLLPEETPDFSKIQKDWRKKETEFWKIMAEFLPEQFCLIKELEIRPTKYGSIATAGSLRKLEPQRLIVYLRQDASLGHLAEAILIALLTVPLSRENYQWPEIEAIIDFLLSKTVLARLFSDFRPTLKALRKKEGGDLACESRKFLQKLGVPAGQIFKISSDGALLMDEKPFPVYLSKEEEKLLQVLILNQNQPVSFDLIAETLWGKESFDRFSLSAIAKLVQRLREKLVEAGLSSELIQTCRGKGYLLLS